MKISLIAVGKMKPSPEKDLVRHYQSRLQPVAKQIGIGSLDIREVEEKKPVEGRERQVREAQMLRDALPKGATVITLDERGKSLTSKEFAKLIDRHLAAGTSDLAFVIGGADGLTPELKAEADQAISLGAPTWPHMLVRVLLLEQIYRATTILTGHPYHKD